MPPTKINGFLGLPLCCSPANCIICFSDVFRSSQLVSNYCDGVDLNCGCPQGWAQKEGIGACLINNPKFVSDVVRQTKNQCKDDLSISVKIRIHSNIER